ncbi:helix-turn-helix domain-containing protein [Nesterenkonia salmonea]|uniref:Helix-turn-helix domain-containing protein n=1 Tax=Nesterenkonia salmonea TaxID=1804987 RepID=A0A5R9B6R6_9MICC|nr:helix-turn-helix domain-containing protein [Nesterenkonia salmonea]TLP92122.1 helix-turn-helix domain-containing protein [Nesterenkonia salmonea]
MPRRFQTFPEVAEKLAASDQRIRALLRYGDLEGVQIGGRGQWRIEDVKLEEYIERMYAE